MSQPKAWMRIPLLFPVAMALAACQVEIQPSLINAGDDEAQTRAILARYLESDPRFASAGTPAPSATAAGASKGLIAEATISGPNHSPALGGRAFYCVEMSFAGGNTDAFKRYAKAEFGISPTTGHMSATPASVTEERCAGSNAPRRFEELIALRQVALKR